MCLSNYPLTRSLSLSLILFRPHLSHTTDSLSPRTINKERSKVWNGTYRVSDLLGNVLAPGIRKESRVAAGGAGAQELQDIHDCLCFLFLFRLFDYRPPFPSLIVVGAATDAAAAAAVVLVVFGLFGKHGSVKAAGLV